MLYITVPDMNDSVSTLSIDGVEYGLRFTYNEKYDYWSFGLYDENMEPIISQTRIVPNFPFLHRKRYSERHLRMYLIPRYCR